MSVKRQTLWSMAPLLVVTLINLVSVPLFYRYLGPERYALWFYVLTFTGVFGFMDLGIGVAVARYIGVALGRGDNLAVKEYWGTGNAIVIPLLGAMAFTFSVLGVVFGPRWFNVDPADVGLLRWSFIAGGVGLFLSFYGQFWQMLSAAYLDFKLISILRTTITLLQVIPSIFLAWVTRSPFILIVWSAAMAGVQLAIFFWYSRKRYGLGFEFPSASLQRGREMALYTGKTFAALLAGSLLASLDRLVLGRFASPTAFTHYTICANAGNRIQGLSQAVMGPVFCNTSQAVGSGGRSSVAAVFNLTFDFVFPWFALLATWLAVWHPLLLTLWLGPELATHVAPLFVPIIVGWCLTAIASVSGAQLGPLDRVGTGVLFNLATAGVLAASVYFGWRWGGIEGVAWGFLFSRIVVVAQDVFVTLLVRGGGWLALHTWKMLTAQIALSAAFYLIVSLSALPRPVVYGLALLHSSAVAAFLLYRPMMNLFQTAPQLSSPSPSRGS